MEKARELLDRFFCTPNIALVVFVVVMPLLCFGIATAAYRNVVPSACEPAPHAPRNLPEGNLHLLR